MKKIFKLITLCAIIVLLMIILTGCTAIETSTNSASNNSTIGNSTVSKITKENYEKIEKGMTKQQVFDIIGEDASISESETPGVGKMELYHYQEILSAKSINIYFVNGKVYMKNWAEL